MMHSGDWPNSISERDLRVSESQAFLELLQLREDRFGVADKVDEEEARLHFSKDLTVAKAAAILPFLAAFAAGETVYRYSFGWSTGRGRCMWYPVKEFDVRDDPKSLSLTYRTDNPHATE